MAEWWQQFWDGLRSGWSDFPSGVQAGQVVGRTLVAALLGGVLGIERQHEGKAAGLRTHMLVALGTAFFVLACSQAGMTLADLSRVVQGVAAGIGFIGAGTILKLPEEGRIRGLTTAAGIWLTAAVGVAVGLGREGAAALITGVAFLILYALGKIEVRYAK
jgi:putative Mg2+ transporter-C (MgtC) family protein